MAADVSYLVQILNGYNEEQQQRKKQVMTSNNNNNSNTDHEGKSSKVLITMDLLGGGSSSSSYSTKLGSKELDLDLQVPNGWEKRLDMKSGEIYLQKSNSPKQSSSSTSSDQKQSKMIPELQDLNFPPSPTTTTTTKDQNLDLKLLVPTNYEYKMMCTGNSVCTLDKVKSALERAGKESSSSSSLSLSSSTVLGLNKNKRSSIHSISTDQLSSLPSSSLSSPSSSMKKEDQNEEEDKKIKLFSTSASSSGSNSTTSTTNGGGGMMFAAGCPGCLSYVLISKMNPKCPRCESIVPTPCSTTPSKKPRLDLNISI